MTEWEKAQAGYLYDANYEMNIIKMRETCADLCYEFNMCRPSDVDRQKEILTQIIGNIKGNIVITAPFYCDYGMNISVGDNVWIGTGVSVLPGVTIGSNTVIGAGSVVNRDIPDGVIAAGNPCRVIRKITEADKNKYPILEE